MPNELCRLMPQNLLHRMKQRMKQRGMLKSGGFLLIIFIATSSVATSQDDVFGDPDPSSRTTESVSEGESVPSPLTRQLVMQASLGNRQLAQSVSALSRTGRWTEVDLLLKSIDVGKIKADVKADMAKRIGATEYLRINRQEDVSPEAKTVLAALAKAEVAQTQSPQRLAAAIKRLGSDNSDDRTAAARVLFAGGNAAIGALADQLTLSKPVTPADDLLPIYARFGNGIYSPLDRYALYGSAQRREKALIALGRLDSDAGNLAALAAIHASDASSDERTIAASLLQRTYGKIPSPAQVTAALEKDLLRKRDTRLADRPRRSTPDAVGTFGSIERQTANASINQINAIGRCLSRRRRRGIPAKTYAAVFGSKPNDRFLPPS